MKWIKFVLIYGLAFMALNAFAQKERKYIRQGNNEFEKGEYENSIVSYRKAIDVDKKKSHEPEFNVGDALYKQEKYEDATTQFNNLADLDLSKVDKAKIYHNLGNSYLKNNKLKESIEAYKDALRNNPNDMETKYNLAYAQKKLEQQQNKDQNKDQDKDKNKDQDKKDQNKNQDKKDQDQNKDKKDQDQNKDQNKQDKQDKNQDQKKQQQPQQISKEDAERILQALANDEKKVQKKVKEQQAAAAKVKVEKEW